MKKCSKHYYNRNINIVHTQMASRSHSAKLVSNHIYINNAEQIGKRGISFSGSQYGSCSTTYNTLPVTKVVYN